MIGKNIIESRPVPLVEVADIMAKRLEEAEEEMKTRKKEKKVAEKPPEPPPAAEGAPEGAAAAGAEAPAPVPVEDKSPLGLEQRSALDYAKKFSKIGKRKAVEMMESLMKIERMKPEIAVKVIDILPTAPEQVRHLFAKERASIDEKQISEILKICNEYRK